MKISLLLLISGILISVGLLHAPNNMEFTAVNNALTQTEGSILTNVNLTTEENMTNVTIETIPDNTTKYEVGTIIKVNTKNRTIVNKTIEEAKTLTEDEVIVGENGLKTYKITEQEAEAMKGIYAKKGDVLQEVSFTAVK